MKKKSTPDWITPVFTVGIIVVILFLSLSEEEDEELYNYENYDYYENISLNQGIALDTNEQDDYSYDNYPHLEELHWGVIPIMYSIINPEECGTKVISQIHAAFEKIQNDTDGVVSFEEGAENAGIFVECFQRYGDNVPISMRASSIYAYAGVESVYDDGIENVIYDAKVSLFRVDLGKYYGKCGEEPVTIIHEILHLFGFEDNGRSRSIMYKYIGNCDLEIDEDIIQKLKEDYGNFTKSPS